VIIHSFIVLWCGKMYSEIVVVLWICLAVLEVGNYCGKSLDELRDQSDREMLLVMLCEECEDGVSILGKANYCCLVYFLLFWGRYSKFYLSARKVRYASVYS